MDSKVITREELYDLVWSNSILSLSNKYNISDVGLRKICIRMSVPIPKAGHWMKIQFGKKAIKPPLPAEYKGESSIVLKLRDEATQKVKGVFTHLKTLQTEIEKNLKSKLKVPYKLINPVPLIISTKDKLLNRKPNDSTYLQVVSRISGEMDVLDIRVAPANLGRTLRFMDTFIKALQLRKHYVSIKEDGNTYAAIQGEYIKIAFREKMKKEVRSDGKWNHTVYKPKGILCLIACKEWKDGKILLEGQISGIIAKMELDAADSKEKRLERKRQSDEYKEEAHQAAELLFKQKKEVNDFKNILEKASRWHKSKNLRNYIDTVEQNALSVNNILTKELKEWLLWARKKADWYDPFIETEDELLKGIDREGFEF